MSRASVALIVGTMVALAVIATGLPTGAAVVSGLALGAGLAGWLWWRQSRRVEKVAREVNRWVADAHEPLELGGGSHWQQLAVALNALGASHERRHHRLAATGPWRSHVVSSMAGPTLLFSAEDRLLVANDAARELLGVEAPAGAPVVRALGSATLAAAVREARAVSGPVQMDVAIADRELRVTASAIGDEVLVMVTDRTQERRVEELRRDFVVNASHELKTPATAISALAEALEVAIANRSERTPQLVARLGEESQRLVRLVHDLLDLRRLEDGGPLERAPLDLAALVREAAAELVPRAEAHDVAMVVDVPERARIVGVAEDLRLVVQNLLLNAIEYNRPGGEVAVELARDGAEHVLTVADSGIGIAQGDLPRIFERFYRVDAARSRERGGTGLGLAIVRHTVERHGGSIRAESLLGEGSTFVVRLPVEPRT